LWFSMEVPVGWGLKQLSKREWHMDVLRGIRAACFQHQDFNRWVFREPVCQHAAGRTGANNDVIVPLHSGPPGALSLTGKSGASQVYVFTPTGKTLKFTGFWLSDCLAGVPGEPADRWGSGKAGP